MDKEKSKRDDRTPSGAPLAPDGCIVVGVGASAGGLEAFQRLLKHMPPHARIAIIYVQHLDPHHESILPELLARDAQMPVQVVKDETPIEPGNVYVIPPNASLSVEVGVLRLGPRLPQHEFGKPIDSFLASLGQDQGDRCIGIILSGTGSDGTVGLRAIREHGGMTIAQVPESAAYDSMPRSAIAAGLVDYVLTPDEMPQRLVEYADRTEGLRRDAAMSAEAGGADETVDRICEVLRSRTGHDFASYKRNTLARRVNRRMDSLQITSTAEYLDRLEQDPQEARELFQHMLIGVTEFFRDPEAFDAVAQRVVPRLFEGKGAGDQVRLWVPGCGTGEEAYSLAILLYEQMGHATESPRVQIFATDIDAESIEIARRGTYPETIAGRVSPERLERFFTRQDGAYRVIKEVRQMVVFSKHSLLHNPPFPEVDLISCRNLLIYLDSRAQSKAIALFHYALRSGGFLFLGAAENIAGRPDLFDPVERVQRIYRRRDLELRLPLGFPISSARHGARAVPETSLPERPDAGLQRSLERAILDEYTPAGMMVRENGDIAYLFGPTAKYLAPSAGVPSLNALSLVRKGLRSELRRALLKATREKNTVVHSDLDVMLDERTTLNLIVRPFTEAGPDAGLHLVIFQEVKLSAGNGQRSEPEAHDVVVERLENELRCSGEQLRATIDELEAANQGLQSANEELLSMNEELQSANEELQSSKEEIQTVNSELESVNRELTQKLDELDTAKSDLESLFEGTQVATIFLDNDLNIKRFTPTATELFRLRSGDVGRPVTDIAIRFANGGMVKEIEEVLRTLQRKEVAVSRVDDDTRYLMRIMPYRTRQNVIDGVVVAFLDITELKRTQEALSARSAALEDANRRKDEFLAMLSHELRNPLSAITFGIELCIRRQKDHVVEHAGEKVRRQVMHMARLLDDLLDTARITRGRVELRRQAVDLRQILNDAVEEAATQAALKKQEITISLPEQPIPVEGDSDRLLQVVGNLLDNARKYTPAGGHISVKAAAEDAQAIVRVRDDGIGIAAELLPRVFELFFQAGAKRKLDRAPGGLGLGLTMVRLLVELHGGSVEAHSSGEGRGSEFVVRLPLSSKSVEAPRARLDAAVEVQGSETSSEKMEPAALLKRILVVDDNSDAADLLGLVLETDGHEVRVVHDGPDALRVSAEWHPDAVLLDIGLPGMDGYEVACRLRQEPGLSSVVLVAVTGYGQEEDRKRVHEAGFDCHLVKPVDMDTMKHMLQDIASARRNDRTEPKPSALRTSPN